MSLPTQTTTKFRCHPLSKQNKTTPTNFTCPLEPKANTTELQDHTSNNVKLCLQQYQKPQEMVSGFPKTLLGKGPGKLLQEPLVKEKLSYFRWEGVVISGHHVILDKGLLLGNSHHH